MKIMGLCSFKNLVKYLFANNWVLCLVLAVVTAGCFYSVLNKGFANSDDSWMLFENKQVFDLNFENIFRYFSSFYNAQYSPINTLLYGLVFSFFGLEPFWYHLLSLILHISNVLLVFFVFSKFLEIYSFKADIVGIKLNFTQLSFFTALLFAIHPMQVESVVWISASKILLYSFFTLWAIWFYLNFLITGEKKNYYLTFILFIVSFGAKEQTVVFPFVLVLIDYLLYRKVLSFNVILEKIPFFVVALILGIIQISAQNNHFSSLLEQNNYSIWQRVILASFSLIEYLMKILMPINLLKFYQFPISPEESFPLKYFIYPPILLVFLAYLYKNFLRNKRYVVFGLMFFIVNLILVIHLIPMARRSFMADRYVYLSSIGLFFLVVMYTYRFYIKSSLKWRITISVVSFGYLSVLFIYTFLHTYNWM